MKTFLTRTVCLLFIALGLMGSTANEDFKDSAVEIEKTGKPVSFLASSEIDVAADFVRVVSPGCFEVQVRVYMTYNGQRSLISSGHAQIGECGKSSQFGGEVNENCVSGYLPNGDKILFDNAGGFEHCTIEVLTVEEVYNQYLDVRNSIIAKQ